MAALTDQQVRHVAKLARLSLTDDQVRQFRHQLTSILAYVEKLNELDTANVEPTAHAAALKNVFREDKSRPGMGIDKVLQNAPDGASPFFRVPKVLDLGEAAP
jgi:aspartyl-tRNA(Asn)/glutamyl-tRNA(Gln) amidotransferase subunit C